MKLLHRLASLETSAAKRVFDRTPDWDLTGLSTEDLEFMAGSMEASLAASGGDDLASIASVIGDDAARRLFALVDSLPRIGAHLASSPTLANGKRVST